MMMTYNRFKDKFIKELPDHLPEGIETENVTAEKINDNIKEGIIFKKAEETTHPTIYIKDIYQDYKNVYKEVEKEIGRKLTETESVKCFSAVLNNVVNLISSQTKNTALQQNITKDFVKQHVFMQLINTEANRHLLHNCPSREFMDLSIIYRIHFPDLAEDCIASAIVKNSLTESLDISEEELYDAAIANTKEILKPDIMPLSGIPFIQEMMQEGNSSEKEFLWAVTSKNISYGATLIIYPEVLEKLGEMIGSNYYLLPSSINEFLATPDTKQSGLAESLADMVNSVNHTTVDTEERLSNQVYYYDRNTKELSVMTDREADLGIDDEEEERE